MKLILKVTYSSLYPLYSYLRHLRELNLHGNEIKEIPKAISKLKELETLFMSENRFQKFHEKVCNLPSLKKLYLDYNDIDEIPKCITNLKKLTILNLSVI